jgi:hypothetical protein
MTIKETIKELLFYYERTRGAGHTRTMVEGAINSPHVWVLVNNVQQSRNLLPHRLQHRAIALSDIRRLNGRHAPLAIDNDALFTLLSDAVQQIESLELEVQQLQHDLNQIR